LLENKHASIVEQYNSLIVEHDRMQQLTVKQDKTIQSMRESLKEDKEIIKRQEVSLVLMKVCRTRIEN